MSKQDKKGALIFAHLQQEGACTLGKLLIERGMRTRTILTPREGLDDIDPLRPDLLIVMGGPVGVYQADDYPFLKDEINILKQRLAADLPTIGICLGSQLMAAALGAAIHAGEKGKEVGWAPLALTAAALNTPVKHLAAEVTTMFHWHGDTFDLPAEAQLLASTTQYENQIFSHGQNGLGIQCHPEVQARQLEEWYVMFQGDVTGKNPLIPLGELRKQTQEHIDILNCQARLFFTDWLDQAGL